MRQNASNIRLICTLLVGVVSLLVAGCSSLATKKEFYTPITAELRLHNYDAAIAQLEAARDEGKYARKDRLLYYIDAGLAHHYAGRFQESNIKLTEAELAAEDLYTKSVSRAVASMLLNDNVLEYAGEDFEILYTNLIMALNYAALNNYEDAFVEVRRANEKLNVLEQKYVDLAREYRLAAADDTTAVQIDYQAEKVRFFNDAFARYLSMHMYAAEGNTDDARIDFDLLKDAFATQPHIYDFQIPDVKLYSTDGAILSVVALTGLAPVKESLSLRLRTDKQLGLVQILYDDPDMEHAEYAHLPIDVKADYYFKFDIPKMVERFSVVQKIVVYANNNPVGELQLLESVGAIAIETFEAKKSLIYLRTVARAIAKGLANHKSKKKADDGGLSGWLKKAAIDVVSDMLENADLRTSQFLPGAIHVGDFEMEPGVYKIRIEFETADGQLVHRQLIDSCIVRPGQFNLVEASTPN